MDKVYKVVKNGEAVEMTYRQVCKDLGLDFSVNPIEITDSGDITMPISKPDEYDYFFDALYSKGYNKRLTDIAATCGYFEGYFDDLSDNDDIVVSERYFEKWSDFEAEEPTIAAEIKEADDLQRSDDVPPVSDFSITVCECWSHEFYHFYTIYVPYI